VKGIQRAPQTNCLPYRTPNQGINQIPIPSAISRQALYNAGMNKRAKKRLKESIEKENQKRAEEKKGQNPSQARTYEDRRGFTPKPEKKRG
jgi:hypothetical protein